MSKNSVVPLFPNIPASQDNHLSKTRALKPFLCKRWAFFNRIVSPIYLKIIPNPRAELASEKQMSPILKYMLMT
jgi:hypothetical protein